MKCLPLAIAFLAVATGAWAQEKTIYADIHNPGNEVRTDVPVVLNISDTQIGFTVNGAVVYDSGKEITSQLDKDGRNHELAFVTDLKAKQTKTLRVVLSAQKVERHYSPRVYAEMLLSDKKNNFKYISSLTTPGNSDVYNLLYHHGPAFESELVAYRIYFNTKQTIDIYGKFHKGLEIQESHFYPNDAQLAKGFGDDVLRVGNSCGVGTLKSWDGKKALDFDPVGTRTESVIASGPVRTIVDVCLQDWQWNGKTYNIRQRYILYAGHRDCQVDVRWEESLKDETLCCGVQKLRDSQHYSDGKGLVACWGTDFPVNDTIKYHKETVGIGVCVPMKNVRQAVADNLNYLYTIVTSGKEEFTYHLTFTSTKETFGYKTPKAWFEYLKKWKSELQNPCTVTLKNHISKYHRD